MFARQISTLAGFLLLSAACASPPPTFEDVPPADEISSDSARLTRAGAVVGTAPYLSPEQCRAGPVDMRADIYAFGCVLYEMLTRHAVFEAKQFPEWVNAHLNDTPGFSETEPEMDIPAAVRELTLACLEKDPDDRPQTWGELVEALAAVTCPPYWLQ